MRHAMLLTSALVILASIIAFAVAFANTDYATGRGPRWTDWLGYASVAAFCVGVFGVLWSLGMTLMDVI